MSQSTKVIAAPSRDMKKEEKQLHIRIPEELYRKLKVRCVYGDTSVQDYLVKLIAESMGERSTEEGSVLIVEDEAIVRESLKDWLKDAYQVATAGTGEEALELVEKQDFDLMIIDVRLPGKTGIEVLKDVKEIKPHIKCIVITAYPQVELAVEAMKLGAVDYLIKPVAPERLERLVWETLVKGKRVNNEKALDAKELGVIDDKAKQA